MYNILTHTDADGIAAAHLFSIAHKGEITGIKYPYPVGNFTESDETFVMLDMKPIRPDFKGVVYDHHLEHPEKRDYQLITEGETPCATGLVFKHFKDKIPKEEWWKVVVGYVGDVQANEIPTEVWLECPELLDEILYLSEYRGEVSAFRMKIYEALSSPINSACRVNQPGTALGALAKCDSPIQLVNNMVFKKFAAQVKSEQTAVLVKARAQMIGNVFIYLLIDSECKIAGLVSLRIERKFHTTTVVYNQSTKSGSIRGVLTDFLVEQLNKRGLTAGGHHGFGGVSNPDDKNIESILGDISKMIGKRKTIEITQDEQTALNKLVNEV